MIRSANTLQHKGATSVLVDSEMETWNMDVSKIEEKITENTKAIMPVHIYGHPCDVDPIMALAEKHDLFVLEDATEAHGTLYKEKIIGSISDAACFSFYANKIIATGERGMITTNNKELYQKAANIRDHAFSNDRYFWHKYLAFNFRMTNM